MVVFVLTEQFDKLTDELAEAVVAKVGPKLVEFLDKLRTAKQDDTLFTIKQAAKYLGRSQSTIRRLVDCGELMRAPGLGEINIRRSVLDAYGTNGKTK